MNGACYIVVFVKNRIYDYQLHLPSTQARPIPSSLFSSFLKQGIQATALLSRVRLTAVFAFNIAAISFLLA
jgi:hypothetical protein